MSRTFDQIKTQLLELDAALGEDGYSYALRQTRPGVFTFGFWETGTIDMREGYVLIANTLDDTFTRYDRVEDWVAEQKEVIREVMAA